MKKNIYDPLSEDMFDQLPEIEPRQPVALSKAKIRAVHRQMREITLDILNSENEDGDSRAERMLDALVTKAENGDIKAAEMVMKIIKELDDKQKLDINIPEIKIVIDNDAEGVRFKEKE